MLPKKTTSSIFKMRTTTQIKHMKFGHLIIHDKISSLKVSEEDRKISRCEMLADYAGSNAAVNSISI